MISDPPPPNGHRTPAPGALPGSDRSRVAQQLKTIFRDPYFLSCTAVIVAWTAAWLSVFPNLYGWLTDDAMTFARIRVFEQGGVHLFDIPWFHAYMWILVTPAWLFHWAVPSHEIPRTWQYTPQFRALILYTILLHSLLLALVSFFLTKLSTNRWICFGAFVLWATSPTLIYFGDLLDSRYLGLLFCIPAMTILLSRAERMAQAQPILRRVLYTFLPGLMMAIGQAVHYNCIYLSGSFAIAYWATLILGSRFNSAHIKNFGLFLLGGLAWLVPVEVLSLAYHPFSQSMIGLLLLQVRNNVVWPHQPSNVAQWIYEFVHEMGVPLMLAAAAGFALLAWKRWRPAHVGDLAAVVMVASSAIMALYLALGRTYPLYRDVAAFQIFYMLFATTAVALLVQSLRRFGKLTQFLSAIAIMAAIAFLPTFVRTPEVFAAQQGLGKAVNFAYSKAGANHVYFMATYDWDSNPKAIISRAQFDALKPSDLLVTDYPIFFHVKYPDIFALLHDVRPVASFPTLWCTQENWVEVGPYFDYRRWQDEPMNCNASVYRMADVLAAERGPVLKIASVTADSVASRAQAPSRVFAIRNPSYPVNDDYLTGLHDQFQDLWKSAATSFPHWLEVRFAKPTRIGLVTIVPPDWEYVGRIRRMKVYGSANAAAPWTLLWSQKHLMDKSIFTVRFHPKRLEYLRFDIQRQGRHRENNSAALVYLRFPGYRVDASSVLSDGAFNAYAMTSQLASSLALGPNGRLWLLGVRGGLGGYSVYRADDHGTMQLLPGAEAVSLTPTSGGRSFAVNAEGKLYAFSKRTSVFREVSGTLGIPLVSVARGARGSVWLLGGPGRTGGDTISYRVFKLEPTGLKQVPARAEMLAIDRSEGPWIITPAGKIARYRAAKGRFVEVTGALGARDLAVGRKGNVWFLRRRIDGASALAVYRISQGGAVRVPGLATAIALGPGGRPWILGADHRVYRLKRTTWFDINIKRRR